MSQERRDVMAVGLTGGIGAGKSSSLALFGEVGAATVSADEIVHAFYAEPAVSAHIAAHFGPAVLDENGAVHRVRLAEAVSGRPDELKWLEDLTHPEVAETIRRRIKEAPSGSVIVCEVPLLFESGSEALFDLVVTVEASPEIRRSRSVHRFDEAMFAELEGLQTTSERRAEGSDLVFFNDGGWQELRDFVREAYELAREMLEENR